MFEGKFKTYDLVILILFVYKTKNTLCAKSMRWLFIFENASELNVFTRALINMVRIINVCIKCFRDNIKIHTHVIMNST